MADLLQLQAVIVVLLLVVIWWAKREADVLRREADVLRRKLMRTEKANRELAAIIESGGDQSGKEAARKVVADMTVNKSLIGIGE